MVKNKSWLRCRLEEDAYKKRWLDVGWRKMLEMVESKWLEAESAQNLQVG